MGSRKSSGQWRQLGRKDSRSWRNRKRKDPRGWKERGRKENRSWRDRKRENPRDPPSTTCTAVADDMMPLRHGQRNHDFRECRTSPVRKKKPARKLKKAQRETLQQEPLPPTLHRQKKGRRKIREMPQSQGDSTGTSRHNPLMQRLPPHVFVTVVRFLGEPRQALPKSTNRHVFSQLFFISWCSRLLADFYQYWYNWECDMAFHH